MVTTNTSTDKLRDTLEAGLVSINIELDDVQIAKQVRFIQLLQKWNRVYNLTAVRSINEMIGRHLLDSLVVLPCLPAARDVNTQEINHAVFDVIDVGTGAGLPVIPLAIARPDLHFLSVESNGKKTRFQQQAVLELSLANVQVKQARIEEVDSQARTLMSRAFTAPDKFLSIIERNCIEKSRVVVMLGIKEKMPERLPAGFVLEELKEVQLPDSESARHIALCVRREDAY